MAHGLCHSAACGIFPDQGSKPCSLHWQADSQPLRHQGNPEFLFLFFEYCIFVSAFLKNNPLFLIFYRFIYLCVCLFMAALGHRCHAQAPSSCSEWGPLLTVVCGPLTVVAFPVVEHGPQACGPQQSWLTGSAAVARRLQAQLPRGMWDPPGPGLEPASAALAGGLLTTEPPGKP